jgi:CHAT domain-containing protein/Tfp pilus assembly protein PilF
MLGRVVYHISLAALILAVLCLGPATAQPGSLQASQRLEQAAARLLESGRYSDGIRIARHSVALGEAALGKSDVTIAPSLDVLGTLYQESGDFTRAELTHRRALALRERWLGREHPATAQSLLGVARAQVASGNLSQAEANAARALAILEKTLGPEHLATSQALLGLGVVYSDVAAYDRAEPLLQRALAIRERASGTASADTAAVLDKLAGLYRAKGAYARARTLYRRTLAIREKVTGPKHPETARAMTNLAIIAIDAGDYAVAEPLFERALSVMEATLGDQHPMTGLLLTNFATLYMTTGAYRTAEALLLRAITIQRRTPDASVGLAISLQNLASIYTETGRYAAAEPVCVEALSIVERMLGKQHPYTRTIASTLGTLYWRSGACDKAEPLLERSAPDAASQVLATDTNAAYNDAFADLNLADLYLDSGSYQAAERLYRHAIATFEREMGSEHFGVARGLGALAILHWARGELPQALALLQRVQQIHNRRVERFMATRSAARKQDYLRTFTEHIFNEVSFAMSAPSTAATALSLTGVLQQKGRVLDAMSDTAARLRRSLAPADQALLGQLATVIARQSMLTYGESETLSSQQYREQLTQLSALQERLETELAKRSQAFRREIVPVTVPNVQRAIPAASALLELFRYTPLDSTRHNLVSRRGAARYVAYVLRHTGNPVAVDLGLAEPLEQQVHRLLAALTAPDSADVKQHAAAVSAQLLGPLRAHLRGVEHILFSPDGELNLLPLAALLDESGAYLVESVDISYLTSGRDLLRMATESAPLTAAVVVADPDYGSSSSVTARRNATLAQLRSQDLDRGGLIFRPLANTALEARELRDLLKLDASRVLLRRDASETRLKSLKGPRILHVATHGFFLDDEQLTEMMRQRLTWDVALTTPSENPLLRSGIALAGANTRSSGEEDGILTALEATQLNLEGTELVVLSACDSAVGEVHNGEGVYGLRRALALAGAQTQLTSLWKVADDATRHLMVDYYRYLLQGAGRAAALRKTQRSMLADPALAHPYYWASFIPIGNWNPLPRSPQPSMATH